MLSARDLTEKMSKGIVILRVVDQTDNASRFSNMVPKESNWQLEMRKD